MLSIDLLKQMYEKSLNSSAMVARDTWLISFKFLKLRSWTERRQESVYSSRGFWV